MNFTNYEDIYENKNKIASFPQLECLQKESQISENKIVK